MTISGLKSAFLKQLITHLGADVTVHPLSTYDMSQVSNPTMLFLHDELTQRGDTSSLRSLRSEFQQHGAIIIPNPNNSYDEEYANERYQSQYGDGGYCADFTLYGLDRVYQSLGIEPDLPMNLGLGHGTAQMHYFAKNLGATQPINDEASFNPGNIVTLSYNPDVAEGEKYNGHTIVVLSSESDSENEGILKIRALEGNAYSEELGDHGIIVSNYLYDINSGDIYPATETWGIHDEYLSEDFTMVTTSVIDPDLLPNANQVSQELAKTSFEPESPDDGYVRNDFHELMKNKAHAALMGKDYIITEPPISQAPATETMAINSNFTFN